MHVLVGDIGGTKTNLALAEVAGDKVDLSQGRRYPSNDHPGLGAIVQRYLQETGAVCDQAAFAVAGPVDRNCSKTTNLPWDLDGHALAVALGLASVRLLNDLEAVAWGIPALTPDQIAVLYQGEELPGNACVVAAGTGLGEAGMFWDGTIHRPFATEGGHTDFAAADEREFALLQYLRKTHGRVSWERAVSGIGIVSIHVFLSEARGVAVSDVPHLAGPDRAAAIAKAATDGTCPVCSETMELFFQLYGREAANMALKQMAVGGVYLGGGIAPKNLELLRQSAFMRSFFDKGRMESIMRRMPVKVILEQRGPLFGAARFVSQIPHLAPHEI
jgi:glucokinase